LPSSAKTQIKKKKGKKKKVELKTVVKKIDRRRKIGLAEGLHNWGLVETLWNVLFTQNTFKLFIGLIDVQLKHILVKEKR